MSNLTSWFWIPKRFFDLRLHIATFLEDIVVQPTRALDQVATPVIGVLKTCVVAVAVVDDVGLADFFVTIATDPEGGENAIVSFELDAQAEERHFDAIERAFGSEVVHQRRQRHAFLHRQRDQPRLIGIRGSGKARAPGAPGNRTILDLGQPRAENARDQDHGIAIGRLVLGQTIVKKAQIRCLHLGLAATHEQCRDQYGPHACN